VISSPISVRGLVKTTSHSTLSVVSTVARSKPARLCTPARGVPFILAAAPTPVKDHESVPSSEATTVFSSPASAIPFPSVLHLTTPNNHSGDLVESSFDEIVSAYSLPSALASPDHEQLFTWFSSTSRDYTFCLTMSALPSIPFTPSLLPLPSPIISTPASFTNLYARMTSRFPLPLSPTPHTRYAHSTRLHRPSSQRSLPQKLGFLSHVSSWRTSFQQLSFTSA
jgi:hypothetical protein